MKIFPILQRDRIIFDKSCVGMSNTMLNHLNYIEWRTERGFFLSDIDYQDYLNWFTYLEKNFTQPIVKHDNPADYGLKQADSVKMRIRYLRGLKSPLEAEYQVIKREYMRGERPFGYITMVSLQEQIDKLRKSIYFNHQRLKGNIINQSYDLEAIKRVPINQICQINNNGFFQDNPFRNEKSPSNSLFWYKSTNRFCDFATNKTGDVVDVYMAVNNCDMRTAMKELNIMI